MVLVWSLGLGPVKQTEAPVEVLTLLLKFSQNYTSNVEQTSSLDQMVKHQIFLNFLAQKYWLMSDGPFQRESPSSQFIHTLTSVQNITAVCCTQLHSFWYLLVSDLMHSFIFLLQMKYCDPAEVAFSVCSSYKSDSNETNVCSLLCWSIHADFVALHLDVLWPLECVVSSQGDDFFFLMT